jgi:uncharacterized protein YcbK (DUF882 family)
MRTRGSLLTGALAILVILTCLPETSAQAAERGQRFHHAGDGRLRLVSEKNGRTFEGAFWRAGSGYDAAALEAIHAVFGAPYDPDAPKVSLRLVAFLDFLEDRLRPGARISLLSGYRSPAYNTKVRARGGLAAKASLHQYGMAADVVMEGVASETIWRFVQKLGFGGAGYYHGRSVHVDVGPPRSWDETTSGVGTGMSDDNKLIGIVTDFDVYRPGDPLILRFIRMTAFPVGVVPVFFLEGQDPDGHPGQALAFEPTFAVEARGGCPQFGNIDQMAGIRWVLPATLPPGRYAARARFCGPLPEKMPPEAATVAFDVVTP